ncbi:Uncharacterised protein [Enterobacter hormaechei]|nr:Uncharacterised protein [Enterobacter hormaechei]SAD50534.1 Uncharacterised protein [Enterobacter hormaechei]SAH08526.1 Uncharacterised protein [Enterobacter hormaechei]SAH74813.1 Uncharacterised protein [Enterobacter hormaechei]VAG52570.1 Uncharacterised protein [Enterobacter hormaechei]
MQPIFVFKISFHVIVNGAIKEIFLSYKTQRINIETIVIDY